MCEILGGCASFISHGNVMTWRSKEASVDSWRRSGCGIAFNKLRSYEATAADRRFSRPCSRPGVGSGFFFLSVPWYCFFCGSGFQYNWVKMGPERAPVPHEASKMLQMNLINSFDPLKR